MVKDRDKELPTTSTTEASAGGTDTSLRRLLPFAWPVFTALWLVFPVGSVVEILRADLAPIRLFFFLVSMVAFVGVFLWLMLGYPFRGWESSSSGHWTRISLLVSLALLALYLEFGYSSGIPYHFMFVVIAAAVTLPTVRAAWTVLATTLLVSGLYALRAGWEALVSTWESAVAPFLIVGLSMIFVSRLVVTVRELQTAREEISRLAVAEERLRFARDLHDLLGHSLSLITMKTALAARLMPDIPETKEAAEEIRDIEGVARGALREVREAVAGYRRPTLDDELAGAREMLDVAGIACHVERAVADLPSQTDSVLAWAVREGTTNVIRHSRAKHCGIHLTQDSKEAHAEVSDDGPRPATKSVATTPGNGLSGLSERVGDRGGKFEAGPLPEGGFCLRVSLPLRENLSPESRELESAANGNEPADREVRG